MLDPPLQLDEFPIHILSKPDLQHRLSSPEQQYLNRRHALLRAHFHASFLADFPEDERALDDERGLVSMVDEPDLDAAVYARALVEVDLSNKERHGSELGRAAARLLERGQVCVVRYSAVRDTVLRGEVELV